MANMYDEKIRAEQYAACLAEMQRAALEWLRDHRGTIQAQLPADDVAIIAPLDDSTIAIVALNDYTRTFLKELERAAEPHGGATFMQGVEILRLIRDAQAAVRRNN